MRLPLSLRERQDLIESYMHAYLKASSQCTDLTIIGIPSKAAALRVKSPTHCAFTQLALPLANSEECVLPMGGTDIYVFAHNDDKEHAREQAQTLLSDPMFIQKMRVFGWNAHILEKLQIVSNAEKSSPKDLALHERQVYTVLEWIRGTWKNARTSEVL